jgi:hypothetical protein
MKPQSAKAKGRKLQQWIAQRITEIFKLEEGDVESRPMGSGGVDLMMSPAARRKFPFSIESKNTKKFPSIKALQQSNVNIYSETLAGVCWKPPGKGPEETIIYFNLEEFMEFWRKMNE